MPTPYSCVLVDLDGTIVDSAPGITATLAYTFVELGLPVPPPAELLVYVGPPLLDSFRDLAGLTPQQATTALAIYRARYLSVGVFDASVYPGMAWFLATVQEHRVPLSLATSKPETPATMILTHYGLANNFDVITGASDDEVRSAKADVVAEALVRLAALGCDVSKPVMVGDRIHDVHGAAAHGVPTIFVEWGYGLPAEAVGAVGVVSDVAELQRLVVGT